MQTEDPEKSRATWFNRPKDQRVSLVQVANFEPSERSRSESMANSSETWLKSICADCGKQRSKGFG